MSRGQLVLAAWAVLVLGLAVRAFAGGVLGPTAPPALCVRPHVVDINVAGVDELLVLPGIGRSRAEAIVLERVRRGPFARIEDLARVDGIGAMTLAGLRDHVRFGRGPLTHGSR